MENNIITNPFAIALYYYYLYLKVKIPETQWAAVARKYKDKSADLLVDLVKKYGFPMPEFIYTNELERIVAMYKDPITNETPLKHYMNCLGPSLSKSFHYDERIDVYSNKFDADYALTSGTLLASNLSISPLDNISRVAHLLPGYKGPIPRGYREVDLSRLGLQRNKGTSSSSSRSSGDRNSDSTNTSSSSGVSNSSSSVPHSINLLDMPITLPTGSSTSTSTSVTPKQPHLFITLANSSLPKYTAIDTEGREQILESPLSLMNHCMLHNIRVRILIRRRHCVRGSLDGYIKAFDKHFNMILTDVDEEFVTNQQSTRCIAMGQFVNKTNVSQRHLPQLFLRGDNVVMIYKVPGFGTKNKHRSGARSRIFHTTTIESDKYVSNTYSTNSNSSNSRYNEQDYNSNMNVSTTQKVSVLNTMKNDYFESY